MRIALDDVEAYYEEHGSGMPLILVHGLGGSTQMWQTVAGPLSERHRVIAYDLRGLGRSTTPPPPYSLAQLVADLDALVEALGLARVALVGHSLGGAVVLAYAARHPKRVRAVVGVSAPSFTAEAQRGYLATLAETARRDGMQAIADLHARNGLPDGFAETHPEEAAAYRSIIGGGDPEGYAALCGVIADIDLTGLGGMGVPVLLVEGELDRVVPPEAVRATAAQLPGCTYVELEGCGHIVPLERPHDLVELVLDFVGRPAELARGV
jgi:pimeloyl-ACP methyl ester carboxylesterase